jgi:carboxyl-terminal processing protease
MKAALVLRASRLRSISAALVAIGLVAGCGGGGGGSAGGGATLERSSAYAGQCVVPRPAGTIDPFTQLPYGDRAGSASTEKSWVGAWIDETYLWYDEVPNRDAANYPDAKSYFDVLLTPALTASGRPKDPFHFTYSTPDWVALILSGTTLGYGIEFAAISVSPPRAYVVAFTDPGTPAAAHNIVRGTELLAVDGVDFANGPGTALNNALAPTSATPHSFTFREPGGATRTVTMTPAQVTRTPVQNVKVLQTATGTVGYLQFNDHIATSQSQLVAAINQLNAQGPISDLVLDIRYNGGGYLDIASQLAYMIAGSARTSGKTFERLVFNDKNPFGFTSADVTPFHTTTLNFERNATFVAEPLPSLGLNRVFVLTGAGTCSASESIINGLRGIDVQVVQIGAVTCGKPYGFFGTDNCGTTYFAIQFQGVNHKGFGDYADGFVPAGTSTNGVPGCATADDFTHALGDPAEARLAAALTYRATGACPPAAPSSVREASLSLRAPAEPVLMRTPLRENRYFRQR